MLCVILYTNVAKLENSPCLSSGLEKSVNKVDARLDLKENRNLDENTRGLITEIEINQRETEKELRLTVKWDALLYINTADYNWWYRQNNEYKDKISTVISFIFCKPTKTALQISTSVSFRKFQRMQRYW